MSTRRQKTIDLVLGLVLGGLIGAIVAVNLIITVGIGYDVSLPQVFRENLLVGIVTTAILISGPIAGVVLMRRLRRQRERDDSTRSLMR
jgi:NhaP-type Na+/H+ or K+/H+ antiporter